MEPWKLALNQWAKKTQTPVTPELLAHIQSQRLAAIEEVSLKRHNIQSGDVLVLRIGHNHPAPFKVLAQSLFNVLHDEGKDCLIIVTPFGLDNMPRQDAATLLETVLAAETETETETETQADG